MFKVRKKCWTQAYLKLCQIYLMTEPFFKNKGRNPWTNLAKKNILDVWQGSKWDKVFKNGPSKICGRQPSKNLKGYGLQIFKGCLPQILLGPFLNTLTQIRLWNHCCECVKSLLHCSWHNALTHFQPMFHFYTPWKHQISSGFFMFSGGIEVDY